MIENAASQGRPLEISVNERHDTEVSKTSLSSRIPQQRGQSSLRILFVCTGNTCRSPMAEAIFRQLASQHFQCTPEKLWERDLDVLSAGVAAGDSQPASSQSITVLKERGIDLSQHLSQQVDEKMLEGSDLILAMTKDHLNVLYNARPDLAGKMRLLSNNGHDVIDPIGGSLSDYAKCAEMITGYLQNTVEEILKKDAEA